MWLQFTPKNEKRFVLKPFVGGVNGISGEPLVGNMTSIIRRMNKISPKQDYLILPEQPWLDGIAIAPGRVLQFVTTPMLSEEQQQRISRDKEPSRSRDPGGSAQTVGAKSHPGGASVEYQVTGKDSVGGIQLQIIPEMDLSWMSVSNTRNVCSSGDGTEETQSHAIRRSLNGKIFDCLKTPSELRLENGTFLHVKDLRKQKHRDSAVLRDILAEVEGTMFAPSKPGSISFQLHYENDGIPIEVRFENDEAPPLITEVS
jgi:hypothetical protein